MTDPADNDPDADDLIVSADACDACGSEPNERGYCFCTDPENADLIAQRPAIDALVHEELLRQCRALGRADMIEGQAA